MTTLIAFVDCESSGLWRNDLPWDHASQPHLVQIACKVVTEDRYRVSEFVRLIKPDGWVIEPDAAAVHRITERMAAQWGTDLWFALAELKASVTNVGRIVGHNLFGFDDRLIKASIARTGYEGRWWHSSRFRMVDTMELATPVCGLPGSFGDAKYPRLSEAYEILVEGRRLGEIAAVHDAGADIDMTEAVYWELNRRGAI